MNMVPRTGRDLAPSGGSALQAAKDEADNRIEFAKHIAGRLMAIVEERHLSARIDGKDYLEYEAWQTIGMFYEVTANVEWTRTMEMDGAIMGWEARVQLLDRQGQVVGTGEMSCGFDEFPCKGKEGFAKHKAARSAAQTWAASKAYRMNYSHVAVLGGFEATTADEMRGSEVTGDDSAPMGFCPDHDVAFQHRQGIGRNDKPYDFWACPKKNGTAYCAKKPEDYLAIQLKQVQEVLGWEKAALTAWLKMEMGGTWSQLHIDKKFESIATLRALAAAPVESVDGQGAGGEGAADQAPPPASPQQDAPGGPDDTDADRAFREEADRQKQDRPRAEA